MRSNEWDFYAMQPESVGLDTRKTFSAMWSGTNRFTHKALTVPSLQGFINGWTDSFDLFSSAIHFLFCIIIALIYSLSVLVTAFRNIRIRQTMENI